VGISHYESITHTLSETLGTPALWIHCPYAIEILALWIHYLCATETPALWIHCPYATENHPQFTDSPSLGGVSLGIPDLLRLAPYLGRTRLLEAVAYTEVIVPSQVSQQQVAFV
jgi:hypothetical protein